MAFKRGIGGEDEGWIWIDTENKKKICQAAKNCFPKKHFLHVNEEM